MSPFHIELSIKMLVKLCALLLNHFYIGLAYEFGITKQDSFFRYSLNFTELHYICNNSESSTVEVEMSCLFLYHLTVYFDVSSFATEKGI